MVVAALGRESLNQDRTGATAGVREQRMPTRWKQPCVIWEASKLDASCSIGEATKCGPHAANTAAVMSARLMRLGVIWLRMDENARYLCGAAIFVRNFAACNLLLTIY